VQRIVLHATTSTAASVRVELKAGSLFVFPMSVAARMCRAHLFSVFASRVPLLVDVARDARTRRCRGVDPVHRQRCDRAVVRGSRLGLSDSSQCRLLGRPQFYAWAKIIKGAGPTGPANG